MKSLLRVPIKMIRSTENERFRFWQGRRSRQCTALSMQPDAVQRRNKPFECRVILLGALYIKPEIDNVAVLNDVIFAFEPDLTGGF